jgi:23S rRNA (uracil1939-C5)-methyltransferase
MKLRRGTELEITPERLDHQGRGQATHEQGPLLLPGAAPGDRALATVEHIDRKKNHFLRVQRILERGPHSRKPPCHHAAPLRGSCGGCPLMHLDAQAQLQLKRDALEATLQAHGLQVEPGWFAAPQPLGYRNRSHFIPARTGAGKARLGSYAPRSHDVAWMSGCQVVRPAIAELASDLEAMLDDLAVPLDGGPQALRSVTLRADPDGLLLVDLVLYSQAPGWLPQLTDALMRRSRVLGVCASVNESSGNALRTGPSRLLAGQRSLHEPVGALSLWLDAASFSQLNSEVAAQIYQSAARMGEQAGSVLDLYCGVGGLGLNLARHRAQQGQSTQVFGVESIERAVELARLNAQDTGLEAAFEVADLSQAVPATAPQAQLVVVNPPRRGLHAPVLEYLEGCQAQRLIYMSCNPETFARDVARLKGAGWRLETLEAYEMLPQTLHTELLGLLVRG